MSIRPTLSAEPVRRKTRMEAARVASELPMVETSCPNQRKVKFRLRKMASGEGGGCIEAVVIGEPRILSLLKVSGLLSALGILDGA